MRKRWTFEPGHSSVEFSARHMMVTYVRGHLKHVQGTLLLDPEEPASAQVEAMVNVSELWTGEPERDAHLKSADFLDAEHFPTITFRSTSVEVIGPVDAKVHGQITIRGITKPLTLDAHFHGTWTTPWWEDGADHGPKIRAGFVARGRLNRHDFGVSWNSPLDRGGVVVGHEVEMMLDAEAILQE